MPFDVYMMCAGSGKRFGGCKPVQLIGGKPNYLRTIELLKELGIEDLTISVNDNYKELFEYENKIVGSSAREIDRFRNFRSMATQPCLFLYGDVVYHQEDLKKIVEQCETANKMIFFGLRSGNHLTKKPDHEIKAIFVWNPFSFYKAVDVVAEKFERGDIKREIGWEVYKEFKNIDFVNLSMYTDDFDTLIEYQTLLTLYDENKKAHKGSRRPSCS